MNLLLIILTLFVRFSLEQPNTHIAQIQVPTLRYIGRIVGERGEYRLYSLPFGKEGLKRGWYMVNDRATIYIPYQKGKTGLNFWLYRQIGAYTYEQ